MNNILKRFCTGSILFLIFMGSWFYLPPWVISLYIICIFFYILIFEWPQLKVWPLTPLYPLLPFLLIIALNHLNMRMLLLFIILITWSHDTGAYLFGRWYGKHKIAVQISPGKSWEGFFGGYFISLICAIFAAHFLKIRYSVWSFPFYVLIFNIAGLMGDLFESFLKRRVSIKDTGNILPGHGGFLDRLDSLLFAVVIFFISLFF